MTTSIYDQLRERWINGGISVNPGVAKEVLNTFQEKRNLNLPEEFKDYLSTVNGMMNGIVDENLIAFLSLDRIDDETNLIEVSPNVVDVTFAEYSLYCHWYVLRASRLGDQLGLFVADREREKRLANSFGEFVIKYLTHPLPLLRLES